jgi:phospholipase/lecithinase/hemolysin
MAYTGVYVFGDSLVDAGNALKLAQWYGNLTFSDLPDGAPTAAAGYYQGRFTNGYAFTDLLSNKAIGTVTKPVFPYGYEDPWIGVPIAPFMSDPSGNNHNFAYGGAQIRQGGEVVPDLDGQTDVFKDVVEHDAPSGGLYIFTMGGNDVRSLAPGDEDPVPQAEAYAALDECAQQLTHEIGQMINDGARHILITGIADVGIIPEYDDDRSGDLNGVELARSAAATDYSNYLDNLIRTEVLPALRATGATVTYVPMMEGLRAILPTLEALHGLAPGTLTTDLLSHRNLVFFDDVHPNAQVHALFGSYAQAILAGTQWIETLPLAAADVDYRLQGSIAAVGEVDKLVFTLVAGTDYRFDLLGMSSLGTAGSLGDPSLRLLSGTTLVSSNADDGAGFDAVLSFRAAATGSHTLELNATGALTGAYQLQAAVIGGTAAMAGQTYTITSAATIVLEGAGGVGVDTVRASVSYALAAGSEVEVLRTANDKGKGAQDLTGNDFAQQIIGNNGANVLEGKGGADVFTGGGGKDVFVLSAAALADPAQKDRIVDFGQGDLVDVSQVLAAAAGTDVIGGGFLRVTSSGLIQVDLDGGGDEWATLSSINGGGAVNIRYLSGGELTTVSASRVAEAQSASALNGGWQEASELRAMTQPLHAESWLLV